VATFQTTGADLEFPEGEVALEQLTSVFRVPDCEPPLYDAE
jgi:hypothetical protein